MSATQATQRREGRTRRFWFAETLVVLGILAFAYFAATLQGGDGVILPSIVHLTNS